MLDRDSRKGDGNKCSTETVAQDMKTNARERQSHRWGQQLFCDEVVKTAWKNNITATFLKSDRKFGEIDI
jgi:hypothetical protein